MNLTAAERKVLLNLLRREAQDLEKMTRLFPNAPAKDLLKVVRGLMRKI